MKGKWVGRFADINKELWLILSIIAAAAAVNFFVAGQRLVRQDQIMNATYPRASTPTPNRMTSSCVVAKTKIHPSNARSAGSG